MRIGSTQLGGLSGGLYEILEVFGRGIFLLLLGSERSSRFELEHTCVRAGAFTSGLIIGGLASVIGVALGGDSCFVVPALLVLVISLFVGLGQALIHYVQELRSEDLPPSSPRAGTKGFDQLFNERRQELEARGYSQRDAEREAWWFARMQQPRA